MWNLTGALRRISFRPYATGAATAPRTSDRVLNAPLCVSYFMDAEPDAMLTEIHRQAFQNPILRLANNIREGGRLPRAGYRAGDLRIAADAERGEFDTILAGRNVRVVEIVGRSSTSSTRPTALLSSASTQISRSHVRRCRCLWP
jgi:hypothetical protein